MFRGANAINLDSKGRLAIPTKYRQRLIDDCQGQLVCTVDFTQKCLLLYPLPEWEVLEQQLRKFSSMNQTERAIQRLMLGYASDSEMDKSGRVLIAPSLRDYLQLDKAIMLVGMYNRMEIWDADSWKQQIADDFDIGQKGNFEQSERLQEFSL
ncbi:MAG: division/cell wall cluster transcriptional repressor MraZ [Pseudomonadota bacterium]